MDETAKMEIWRLMAALSLPSIPKIKDTLRYVDKNLELVPGTPFTDYWYNWIQKFDNYIQV